MRKTVLTLAALATALPTAPALAQSQQEGSSTRQVLGRVLDAVFGKEKAEEEAEEVVETEAVEEVTATSLSDVLAHERRADDRARDRYRNPAETMAFFRVEPNHSVVEYAPGGGWYTRVIAPYVRDAGSYAAMNFPPAAAASLGENFVNRVRQGGESFSERQSEALGIPAEQLPFYFGDQVPEELHGTVDRVLMIRMLHNLVRWNIADSELGTIRKLLKDDGLLGVVQHRAPESQPWSMTDGNRGYLQKSDVVAIMALYGFELVAESEINANPYDPADHEIGVWTLPPTYARGDEDRDRYTAIGETDRMTLLFRKAD